MKKITMLSLGLATLLNADILKVELGLGIWSVSPNGNITYQNVTNDLENDLDFDGKTLPYLYADLQHPIPVLPNLRLEYTNITTDGNPTAFRFGSFDFSGNINSKIELQTIDFILYYNLWDTAGLNVDFGLDIKYIDGFARVQGEANGLTQTEEADFKAPIPHLYGNIRYDLPIVDLGVETSLKYLTFNGASSYDWILKADYNFFGGFKLEAGYRTQGIKIPTDVMNDYDLDTALDYDFSGPFVGLNYTF